MPRVYSCILLFALTILNSSACPNIVSRTRWSARPPKQIDFLIIPVENVVIHHTESQSCTNERRCMDILKNMQDFHMDDRDFDDIAYNFLVGGDGNIYEGVGWNKVGAHTRGYNTRSISLGFLGNFEYERPSEKMLRAAKELLECGVSLGQLDSRYKLFGARQVRGTTSPGLALYNEIINWPHFTSTPK